MPQPLYERLFRHSKPLTTAAAVGPSIQDVGKIPVTSELIEDLVAALQSPRSADRNVALFFCEGLLDHNMGDPEFVRAVVPPVETLIMSDDDFVRSSAVPVYARLRDYFPGYRERMLTLLADCNSLSRERVLYAAGTFLKRDEVQPLLSFQNDTVISETGGMGGPWRYILRDEALRLIEKMLGQSFRTQECTEARDNQVIFWWDWTPFLQWWAARKR
jgi:hypothetical protein